MSVVLAPRLSHLRDLITVCALFVGNLLVVLPYLRTDLSGQPWNNDYLYYQTERILRDNPWTWNSLWYCGTPLQYIYPPLFHVLVAWVPVLSIGRSFHLLSAAAYSLVPVSCYLLGICLFKSRYPALLVAVAYSLFPSPVYIFQLWSALAKGYHFAPWPFIALIVHAESPHTAALAMALLCVAATWRGYVKTAVVFGALVFLLNWVGLFGLIPPLAAVGIAKVREPSDSGTPPSAS